MKKSKTGIRKSAPDYDKVFYAVLNTVVILCVIIAIYPIIYVFSASFSSPEAIESAKVWLLPVDFSLDGYKAAFKTSQLFVGYRNTIFYTFVATVLNVMVTMGMAYALSRKNLVGKKFLTIFIYLSTVLNGGLIPQYILYNNLGITNTIWVMILPGMFSMYFVIVARTSMESTIPNELWEAAKIDGCSDIYYFFKIIMPLSKSIMAVVAVNCAVGHWNDYFTAMIYLTDENLYPLQLVLKNILVANEVSSDMLMDLSANGGILETNLTAVLKYSTIVLSLAPIFCALPFLSKYFVKGVMLGSVKG